MEPSPGLGAFPDLAEFTSALTNANIDVADLVADEKGTVCEPTAPPSSLGSSLVALTGDDGDGEIALRHTLSRGGMGQVILAQQRSIGRDVAVKLIASRNLAPGAAGSRGSGSGGRSSNTAAAEAQLIVEARVAGQLEHPNIVPVHILGTTRDGQPLIVMKRIEGESWKTLLGERRDAGRVDLARDLDILMDVCRALHFAHSRGVVHRDVKPANVMVGRFGEVYLLDWGIAVGYGTDTIPELPHARDVKRVVGTPQYMAPEMAFPEGNIDPRTDVYLVGAVLFELLTGTAPHLRPTMEEILYAAHTAAEPELPDDVPEELAAICRNAMKRDPRERYQSAEELRSALATFKSHAVSRDLCAAAEERLIDLLSLPPDAEPGEAQRVFTECRFGFTQALKTWPESVRAREGLERAVAGMAMREAQAGRYDSARMLAAELDAVPPTLQAELDVLAQKRRDDEADRARLEVLQREGDVTFAGRERAFVVWSSAVSWLVLLVSMYFLDRFRVFHAESGTFAIIMGSLAALIAAAGLALPHIRSTTASRSLYLALLLCVMGIATLHLVGWWFSLAPAPMLAIGHTLLATCLLSVAAQDGRLWKGAALCALIVPAILALPAHAYLVSGVLCFVALSAFSWAWRDTQK